MRLIFVIYAPKRQMADKCAIASAECESRWRRVHFIELKFGRTRGAELKKNFLSKSQLDSLEFPKINQTLHSWRQIQIFTLLNFRCPRSSHWIYFFFENIYSTAPHTGPENFRNEFRTIFGLKRNTLRCSTPAEVTQAVRSLRSSRVNWRATWPVTRVLKVPQRISSSQQEKKAPSGHGAQRSSTYRTLQLKQFVFFTLSVKRCDWLVNWLNQ